MTDARPTPWYWTTWAKLLWIILFLVALEIPVVWTAQYAAKPPAPVKNNGAP